MISETKVYSTEHDGNRFYFKLVVRPDEGGNGYELAQIDLDDNLNPFNDTPIITSPDPEVLQKSADHLIQYGKLPGVSYRQTRKGDWMVCAVAHATYGPGIHKTGSPAPGYTTGQEYGRYHTEIEADDAARRIADEIGATVVEWQHPEKNPQFIDLPKKYPDLIAYSTLDDAEADGWIRINPSKTVHHYRGHVIHVRDVTPGRSFGYELVIVVKGYDRVFAASREIWANKHPGRTTGVFDIRFRTGDVVDAINEACKFIDSLD